MVGRIDNFHVDATQWHATSHLFRAAALLNAAADPQQTKTNGLDWGGSEEEKWGEEEEGGEGDLLDTHWLEVRTKVSHQKGSPITFFLQELWLSSSKHVAKEPIISAIVTIAAIDADTKQLKGLRGKHITAHGVRDV